MIKTYRGILADGGQDKINLKTLQGDIGYRIVKFSIFPSQPGQQTVENTVLIWKLKQSSVSTTAVVVDFTDGDLLGVAMFHESHADSLVSEDVVVFDREIINQDIYITHTAIDSSVACNYYLELEQVKLNENESTMATLQSLRRLSLPRN
jgi:hypothetical protein